jgi:hypothetical protein
MPGRGIGEGLSPKYKFVRLNLMELRERPGELFEGARRGTVFLICKNDQPVGILSGWPGAQLNIGVKPSGSIDYSYDWAEMSTAALSRARVVWQRVG